ncbi:MAG: bacteriocin [Bacteroidales bacterium]|jgi:bacteriocin-like protein
MDKMNFTELNHNDLIQINGGTDEVAYNTGYAAGQIVGKMVKNFLTLTGIWRLVALI